MTLNPLPDYPSSASYVLKLRRDARPQQGLLSGRVVHIASGDSADFASADALLAWLLQHAASHPPAPSQP